MRHYVFGKGMFTANIPVDFLRDGGRVYGNSEWGTLHIHHPEIGWWEADPWNDGGGIFRACQAPNRGYPEYRHSGIEILFGSAGGAGTSPDSLHWTDMSSRDCVSAARRLGFFFHD